MRLWKLELKQCDQKGSLSTSKRKKKDVRANGSKQVHAKLKASVSLLYLGELRAPTTDLCDLGLSVDPGTVFVSLYFAQVLRESCLCFRYGRRICKRRCGSGTDTAFQDELAEGGQGLPGGATAPCASVPPPPPRAASGCGSKSNWTEEVFSTAQMTQIAQIVSLSLNQAMGEFNMRLNGLHNQLRYQLRRHHLLSQVVCHHLEIVHPPVHNPRNTVEQPPGLQQSPQRLVSEVRQGQGTAQNTQGEASSQDDRDVFTKSEKSLPPLPKCEHGTWRTREQDILGFAGYVQSLRSWVALASDTFGWELESALSWPHELHMTNLKPAQQLHSARLLAILT